MQNSPQAYPAVKLEHGVTTVLEGSDLEYLSDEETPDDAAEEQSDPKSKSLDENNQELEQELEEVVFGDAEWSAAEFE
eukprot:1434549-Amphidinium_carterae.1